VAANTKIVSIFLMLLLCVGMSNAKLFQLDSVTPSFYGCSILGCTMMGDIDMNGFTIYNVTFLNASICLAN
jgi:hypothetical protein